MSFTKAAIAAAKQQVGVKGVEFSVFSSAVHKAFYAAVIAEGVQGKPSVWIADWRELASAVESAWTKGQPGGWSA